MFGLFCRQFSIAVCDGAVAPPPLPTHTTCLLPFLIPKPFRNPLWRNAPTDEPPCSAGIPLLPFRPLVAARAYRPIRMPAFRLFVANSASTALGGSVGESRA